MKTTIKCIVSLLLIINLAGSAVLPASAWAGKGTASDDAPEITTVPTSSQDLTVVTDPQQVEAFRARLRKLYNNKKPIVALVLGGGGARGAAHVGVLKVLQREHIPIDMVVGTSIGAIVGGFYCAGIPIEKIEDSFRSAALMKHFMTVPLAVRVLISPILLLPRLFVHPYDGLYWGGTFRNYLYDMLPDDEKNIEELKIPFSAIATNLMDGTVHNLTTGNLARAMQASSAVPGLRKPVEIGDRLYCDGAMLENVPVMQARKLGADVIIAVNIDERFPQADKDSFRKIGSISKRIVTMQLYRLDKPSVDQATVTIHPNTTGISLISRSKKDGTRGIEEGEKAAEEALPMVKKALAECGLVL